MTFIIVHLLHCLLQYPVGEMPVRTKTPENKTQFLITKPSKGALNTITQKRSMDSFLEILCPKIREFLSHQRLPVWMPPETVDANVRQFYRNLAIPRTNENKPNLLLHNLGKKVNPNVENLFRNAEHHR